MTVKLIYVKTYLHFIYIVSLTLSLTGNLMYVRVEGGVGDYLQTGLR